MDEDRRCGDVPVGELVWALCGKSLFFFGSHGIVMRVVAIESGHDGRQVQGERLKLTFKVHAS